MSDGLVVAIERLEISILARVDSPHSDMDEVQRRILILGYTLKKSARERKGYREAYNFLYKHNNIELDLQDRRRLES